MSAQMSIQGLVVLVISSKKGFHVSHIAFVQVTKFDAGQGVSVQIVLLDSVEADGGGQEHPFMANNQAPRW